MSKNKVAFYFRIVLKLVKYQLSLMVSFSALTGYLLTRNGDLIEALMLLTGVFFLAAGAAVLNQVQERESDQLMVRTKYRPLPAKQITASAASAISLCLMIMGIGFLGLLGWLPMMLGILNIILYNFIYTPLKRSTWLAIIPGSLVGAVPPMIGWTAGGLSVTSPEILFVSLFVGLWQVPHFWLIFLRYRQDYKKAGLPVFPTHLDATRIKKLVFSWALLASLFLCSFPLFGLKFSTLMTGIFVLLNLLFITLFYRFLFGNEENHSLGRAFILINSFALWILLVLAFGNW
jgi:heme o synthase